MDKSEIKVQMIGNYLRPLVEPLKKYGITFGEVGSVIDGCSILAMEDKPNDDIQYKYIYSKPYDKSVFTVGCLMSLQKNLSFRLSRDPETYGKCFCFDSKNKSERRCNDSEYIIVYNSTLGAPLYEKNGCVFSDVWPPNRFIRDIKADSDYKCHNFPFSDDFNWKFYYNKSISAIMREYDSEHIILIKTNSSQWFLNDNEIGVQNSESSQWRNRVEEMDNYFIQKTNCLVIDELYNHIPLEVRPCSFLYSHPSQINYRSLAKSISNVIFNGRTSNVFTENKLANPFAKHLFRKLSSDILDDNLEHITLIENKWLSLYRLCNSDWRNVNDFFNDIIRLNKFLDIDNGYTLSDYVIQLLRNKAEITELADLNLIELYTKYMKLNINDIIAVYMLCSEFADKSPFKKIIKNVINNSDCLPLRGASQFVRENLDYLKEYPFVQPELKIFTANQRHYIALGKNVYLVIDPDSESLIEKQQIAINDNVDCNVVFDNDLVCDIMSVDALSQSPEFYIERTRRTLADKPVTVFFEKVEDFIESLNYIDYVNILSSEKFVIALSGSNFMAEISEYEPIVDIDHIVNNTVVFPSSFIEQSTGDCIKYLQVLEQLYFLIHEDNYETESEKVRLSNNLIYGLHQNKDAIVKKEFGRKIGLVLSGFKLANDFFSTDKGHHYFIKLFHLGDNVRSMTFVSLFREYYTCQKTLPINKIVVVTTPNYKELMMAYKGVDEVITFTKEELYYLREYSASNMCIHNIYDDTFQLVRSWGEPNLCSIYKIPEEFLFSNPELVRFPNKMTDNSMENARSFFEANSADPERTVIIIPYAQSSGGLDHDIFKETIAYFKKVGYTVFTNAGLGEEILEDTIPLSETADVVFSMAAMGAIIIGVQSGIMDAVEWFDINIKFVFLSILNARENIRMFYNSGKFVVAPPPAHDLSRRIERRKGAVSIAIATEQDRRDFSNDVIFQSKIYVKGNLQNRAFDQLDDLAIFAQSNLNDYITEAVKLPHIVIFISVCDSADRYWNLFDSRHILGLKEDLSTKMRLSYLAVIDPDSGMCDERLSDKWNGVEYSYSFNDNDKSAPHIYSDEVLSQYGEMPTENYGWIYSCAMDKRKYTMSRIVINGIDYSMNRRGLNIVLYSKDKSRVIDSINVDMFGDKLLNINRKV